MHHRTVFNAPDALGFGRPCKYRLFLGLSPPFSYPLNTMNCIHCILYIVHYTMYAMHTMHVVLLAVPRCFDKTIRSRSELYDVNDSSFRRLKSRQASLGALLSPQIWASIKGASKILLKFLSETLQTFLTVNTVDYRLGTVSETIYQTMGKTL